MKAALALLATTIATTPNTSPAGVVGDAEALAITHKHCVMCHAAKPSHPAFDAAPNGVTLETLADLKKYARRVYSRTVQNRAMPLGNQTGMTEDERAALGRWLKALP